MINKANGKNFACKTNITLSIKYYTVAIHILEKECEGFNMQRKQLLIMELILYAYYIEYKNNWVLVEKFRTLKDFHLDIKSRYKFFYRPFHVCVRDKT